MDPNTKIAIILGICFVAIAGGIWWFFSFSRGYYERYSKEIEEDSSGKLQSMFMQIRPDVLIGYKMGAALGAAALLFLILRLDCPTGTTIVVPILGGLYFFFIPDRIIKHMYEKRLTKFNDQMVDGLSIMANALRSGLSFPQALDLLSREMDPPISTEFQQVSQDTKLGMQLDDALKELGDRVPLEDLNLLVTAITIVRRSGGNLAEIFENISVTIRERRRIQMRIESLTSTGKLQAWIVCLLPIFIASAMFLIDPPLIRPMWNEYTGNILLLIMFTLQFVGYKLIIKICTIDI